ncbi:hypothetical protein O7599_00600 [Streptomyces sp. WMMC500]|uniref:hypothetical protein n=1 Tax=Streptomyces sp. WMMC500 TaxID=3015154 RepID=UPI00248C5EAB|nr:hypothetical protein [Streptomyces sp. WMMC500]WBB61093.1 hypothetical protein O7599_00600 [Streptomyces sp. WMMC500]
MGDDDRNTWLDQRAAERLLAGEQVDAGALTPADRHTAERLAALLDTAARAGRPALDTELPGEQAALAAFRAARAAPPAGSADTARNGHTVNGEPAHGPAATGRPVNSRSVNGPAANGTARGARVPARRVPAEPVVRLASPAPVHGTPRRLRRLRTAAAVVAACCVLGGVVLAAGAVLRTAPAAPGPSTGPAVSPTSTAEPEPTGDYANEGAASAGGSRLDDRPEGRRDEPDTGTAPGGGADDAAEPDGTRDEDAGQGGSGGEGEEEGTKGKSVERLCEKFFAVRDGKEKVKDKKSWNRLVREAGGERAIAAYCEKHFGNDSGGDGGNGDDGNGDEDDGDDEDGDDD